MRILIIDPRADALKNMLNKLAPRHQILSVEDPVAARLLFESQAQFDLVVVHPQFAEDPAVDLVSQIRAINPEQKIMMLHYQGGDDIGVDAMETAILFKPKSMLEIITQIEWLQAV